MSSGNNSQQINPSPLSTDMYHLLSGMYGDISGIYPTSGSAEVLDMIDPSLLRFSDEESEASACSESHQVRKRRRTECKSCLSPFRSRTEAAEHQKNCPVAYTCEKCHFSTTSAAKMQRHQAKHTAKQCSVCNKTYYSRGSLDSHIRRNHRQTQCICEYCGKVYSNESSLGRHIRQKHPDMIQGQFECSHCHRSFFSEIGLRSHVSQIHPRM